MAASGLFSVEESKLARTTSSSFRRLSPARRKISNFCSHLAQHSHTMAPLRLTIEKGLFRDGHGREVTLRGINVAGDAKYPSNPDQPSHIPEKFFDGDNVDFHSRPFSQQDAHIHFSRLKRWGYNTIRYIFTWEAIESVGPGIYDEEWIQHTIEILRLAKSYGFYIFMDPHQDVVSIYLSLCHNPMLTYFW